MVIHVATGGVTVRDIHNFRRLHVELCGVDDPTAATAVAAAGLGTLAGGDEGAHAWLEISALRDRGEDTAEWCAAFDDMIAYARRAGWVDGTHVRAHLVRN